MGELTLVCGEVSSAGVVVEVDRLIYVVLDGGKDDFSSSTCYVVGVPVDEGREDGVEFCVQVHGGVVEVEDDGWLGVYLVFD